jgi:zinc protease
MIRFLLAVAFTCIWQIDGWAASEVRSGVTPSGLSFLYVRTDVKQTVAICFNFEGGSANDGLDGPSAGSVAAAALFLGADGMTDAEITEAFQDFGANFALQTNVEDISGIVSAPIADIQATVTLANRVLTKPDFPLELTRQLIETTSKNVQDAQSMPEGKAQKTFAAAVAEPHPYAAAIIGDPQRIRKIMREDLYSWIGEHFSRDRLKVSIVGDLNESDMALLVDRLFLNVSSKSTHTVVPPLKLLPIARQTIVVPGGNGDQAWVLMGGATLDSITAEARLAAAMIQMIFSHGSKSRLFAAIREDGGNSYGMAGQLMIFQKVALQLVFGRVAKTDLGSTLDKLRLAWSEYRQSGPNEAEIQDIKQLFLGWYLDIQNDATALANFVQANQLIGISLVQMNNFEGVINGLDLKSVHLRQSLFSEYPVIITVD